MISPTASNIARAFFVAMSCLLGIAVAVGFAQEAWIGALGGVSFGLAVAALDRLLHHFTFRGFSHATFGLLVGLLCAWLVNRVDLLGGPWMDAVFDDPATAQSLLNLGVYLVLGFLGVSLALRSNSQEFSLIIPYVRLRQDSTQDTPLLIDSNILIDGRILSLCNTGFIGGSIVAPSFILEELQLLADSGDPLRRSRGQRGLDTLEELRNRPGLHVSVHEETFPDETTIDAKLIACARRLGARILTNDSSLGRVARVQNLTVLNLNELLEALKPELMPGDLLDLKLVREGKDGHQAVGFLPDGTMIVVNHAREHIGNTVPVVVAGTHQTASGRLVFAELGIR